MPERYQHLFLNDIKSRLNFRAPKKNVDIQLRIPDRDRGTHSGKLLDEFAEIWQSRDELLQTRTANSIPSRSGTYLEFNSGVDADLITKSLESISKGIRLLNIREIELGDNRKQTRATVYIPNGLEGFFIKKVDDYQNKNRKTGKPYNANLVESIEDVRLALLESLWTDNLNLIPEAEPKWCEAWLNVSRNPDLTTQQLSGFVEILLALEIFFKDNTLFFPERAVILIKVNKAALIEIMLRSDLLAEIRAGQETAGFWMEETLIGQQQWVTDLLNRIQVNDETNIKVCILDKGVNNGHPLLQPVLSNADTMTVNEAWGTYDHHSGSGHGTLMAGVVTFGHLESSLAAAGGIVVAHKLCSVKILPPPAQPQTPIELWGDITRQGVYIAEIQNPDTVLLFCLPVTSKEDVHRGRPSSWSGAIDQLAFGDETGKRLIIISAGNVDDQYWDTYPDSNIASSIDNPAQAWNALVVGAYTDKVIVNDVAFTNHQPLAPAGGLSPYSTTSYVWERKWPVKPDVVFEGGNLLRTPAGTITSHADLDILSTAKNFNTQPFATFWATSAATAYGSWFTAQVTLQYPEAWIETVRGLIVHSAELTPAMFAQFALQQNKTDRGNLMKIFGYGIPNLEKALYSSESALTMIAQEEIQPFAYKDNGDAALHEMHFFKMPWPAEILLQLGPLPVKLRVTLSYFIEPGLGEIGWKDRYRYQSHGLRFDVNNVGEEEEVFKKRINSLAREEGEVVNNNSGSNRWVIGANNRNFGSVNSDFWEGTAADLATCNMISVFPIIGWWKERKHLERVTTKTRYSLIVSLETESEDIEMYTTIRNMISIPIEIRR